jgi:uncharacterized protein YbbK (DUF523 family)/uncharacterized protein YbgA (DUF1722 family)
MQLPRIHPPIRIGISRCLLGERVRYDGGHKLDRFLADVLGRYVQWVPVCPEVEIGLGTPREPIHLVQLELTSWGTSALARVASDVRLIGVESGKDHTAAMRRYARRRVAALAKEDLCGYVLKKDSPSCGVQQVKVRHAGGRTRRSGRGLFAEALLEKLPNLPVEEEDRLRDPRWRENWIERVFAYRRLKELWSQRWSIADLAAFHAAQELAMLAHSPRAYRELGRLLASAKSVPRQKLRERYEAAFMAALAKLATRRRHAGVLLRALGHLDGRIDAASGRDLRAHVKHYRDGSIPLVVLLALLSHYSRIYGVAYLLGQTYLHPHPAELALRHCV